MWKTYKAPYRKIRCDRDHIKRTKYQGPIPAKTISIPCNEFVGTPILVEFTILYLHKSARRCNVLNEVDFSPSSILAAFQL